MQKRFITMFNTQGWIGMYIVGVAIHWLLSLISTLTSYLLIAEATTMLVVQLGISILQTFLTTFFYTMAYSKAVLLFINKTTLDGKKVTTSLKSSSFFLFVFSNILVCVFTLGIYIPWAYRAIIDKVVSSLETEEGGRFAFLSKVSSLFSVFIISFTLIVVTLVLSLLSFIVGISFSSMFSLALTFCLIGLVLFVAFLASIVSMQIFIIKWCINLYYSSPSKKVTYTLNINIASAIFFYLGQLVLVAITLGFYTGAFLLNTYRYVVERIEEKENDVRTGSFFFIQPLGKGAGFLLIQVILCFLTAGIYVPFAYTEYARFFINNTYLYIDEKKDEQKEVENKEIPASSSVSVANS